VVVLSKKTISRNNNLNKHYLYDTASAVANLTFQANSLDLYVHQMGGFDAQLILEKYLLSDEFEPAVVLAIGRKVTSDFEKTMTDLDVKRNPLHEILFENKFGNIHSILNNETVTNN